MVNEQVIVTRGEAKGLLGKVQDFVNGVVRGFAGEALEGK